jgi:mycoredoxin
MQLTKLETAVLQRLVKYRTVAPTLGERLRAMLPWMTTLLMVCVALGVVLARLHVPGIVFLPAGIFLGALGRDLGSQRQYVKWWPINHEIMDWNRVEQLLNDAKVAPPPEQPGKARVKWALAVGLCAFAAAFGIMVVTNQAKAYVYNPTRNNPPNSVIVLTASWCPYCESLRRHLVELNIPYTELDVDHTTEGRFAFSAVRGTGIPITVVGQQVIRGLGKTAKWETVDAALKQAGYPVAPEAHPGTAAAPDSPDQFSPR